MAQSFFHRFAGIAAVWLATMIAGDAQGAELADSAATSGGASCLMFVGVSTDSDTDDAIYVYRMDRQTGALTEIARGQGLSGLNYMTFHPNGRLLYAAGNTRERNDVVAAFSVDPQTGRLERLNDQSAEGSVPCHLAVDDAGTAVLVANYSGGSVASLPIEADGRLRRAISVHRHTGASELSPRAHSINLDPTNQFACAADLGLDQLRLYRFDRKTGALTPHDPPFVAVAKGHGPRHGAFHPSGKFFYVIHEADCTLSAFTWNADQGSLTEIQTLTTIPVAFQAGFSTAELFVHPNGRFVYGSNRGHDTIAIFAVDQETGRLTPLGHTSSQGKTPRNFAIDDVGTFLMAANQEGDSLVQFRIDAQMGTLRPTGLTRKLPVPMCIRFLAND